jgi:hypothetical protein
MIPVAKLPYYTNYGRLAEFERNVWRKRFFFSSSVAPAAVVDIIFLDEVKTFFLESEHRIALVIFIVIFLIEGNIVDNFILFESFRYNFKQQHS